MTLNLKHISILAAFVGLAAGCSRQTESPIWQFMPHMANTPALKAMKGYDGNGNGSSMLLPPEHSVARGHKPYRYETVEAAEAAFTRNPLPRSMATLKRGQTVFNTYCITCHGERGLGDGPVVNPFPIPKSLQSDQMLKWNDGHLYHVIVKGQGVMPSYAQQVQPEDRWAVIHYVRALQRAQHPTAEDLRIYKSQDN